MGDRTTISVTAETKDELDVIRRDGETWDAFLQRLAGEGEAAESEALDEMVLENQERLADLLERIPERTAERLDSRFR